MRRPGLIVCDISGDGADGPYRDKKAKNLLIQSEAGLLSVTGTPEVPGKAGASIAAGMYAYTNILAALMHRQRTGRGQRIDIAMLEALTEWMGYPLYYSFDGAVPPQPALAQDARFATNALRSARRAELGALITDAFAALSGADVARRLNAAGPAAAGLLGGRRTADGPGAGAGAAD